MKNLLIFIAFLMVAIWSSCGRNKGGEDVIMEDFFPVQILIPDDNVRETLSEYLLPFVTNLPDDYGDTICIGISCPAFWTPVENDNMFSLKITEIENEMFFLTINDDTEAGHYILWDRLSDRPLIRDVTTILDTGTYSLHCEGFEETESFEETKSFFDDCREYDSIVRTDIIFEMCFLR